MNIHCILPNIISFIAVMSSKPSQESGSIPSDVGGMTGVARDEALYQQAYGESIYDRDASAFMTVSIVSFFVIFLIYFVTPLLPSL